MCEKETMRDAPPKSCALRQQREHLFLIKQKTSVRPQPAFAVLGESSFAFVLRLRKGHRKRAGEGARHSGGLVVLKQRYVRAAPLFVQQAAEHGGGRSSGGQQGGKTKQTFHGAFSFQGRQRLVCRRWCFAQQAAAMRNGRLLLNLL